MYKVALLHIKVSILQKANKGLSKRRKVKKIHIRLRGSLIV